MLVGVFFLAFLGSLFASIVLIRTQHLHAHLSMDTDLVGVQKFHANPTPRIGGLSILLGMLLAFILVLWTEVTTQIIFKTILLSSIPVFTAGFLEDITKKVAPRWRLIAAFISAALGIGLCGSLLPKLGVPGVDAILFLYPVTSILLTIFAVGGVCHSINIIDGYNGLMGGVSLFALLAFAFVSLASGDIPLLTLCLASIGAVLGFLVWNFPKGMIFAGDSGAYFIGFLLAEIAVLLVSRHPALVSPWFPFLVLIYPVFETVFSIYRRKIRHMPAGLPDSMHFHQMVYKRLVLWMVGSKEATHLTRRNSMTAPYLWGMALFSIMPAMIFWRHELLLKICALIFVIGYLWAYRSLATFNAKSRFLIRK
ncbi:MraY family glycosyltransferase [Leeia oryzae]|uniref:MraY family glycosyltransferase n=1 Tax=Leeia oryzae TaxID=356662 RepID=UPI000370E4AB|nr:glycosyltransferase [Leeia oryzae]